MARAAKTGIYISEPKNEKSIRRLNFPAAVANTMLPRKDEQSARAEEQGDKWVNTDFVLKAWNGDRMKLDFANQRWGGFRKECKMAQDVNFRALRHTAATLMLAANTPISTVSGVLGHAQISTTVNIYTHVIEDTKKAAIQAVAGLLTPKKRTCDISCDIPEKEATD